MLRCNTTRKGNLNDWTDTMTKLCKLLYRIVGERCKVDSERSIEEGEGGGTSLTERQGDERDSDPRRRSNDYGFNELICLGFPSWQ